MFYFFLVILSLFTIAFVGFKCAIIQLAAYGVGFLILLVVNKNDGYVKRLYNVLFLCASTYLLMCYTYMRANNYEWLLAFDTYNSFLPETIHYMQSGNYNFISILSLIFEDYILFSRDIPIYFVYSCFWGLVAHIIDADLYYVQQLSVLFLYLFVGIVLYKIMLLNRFTKSKAMKYTIIICTCSTIFFYSSQILRDIHILLLSLLAIYYTFKQEFSLLNLLKIILCIILITGLRVESGLFMCCLIPAYIYIHLNNKGNIIYKIFLGLLVLICVFMILLPYATNFSEIFEANRGNYIDDVSSSDGIIGSLQKIPIIGDILSIIYNAIQPVPFWQKFSPSIGSHGSQAYNVMRFVSIFSSFFHLIVIVYIIVALSITSIRKIVFDKLNKSMKVQLLLGFVFLYLQSAVISQRRLLPYYCVYYILFFIIYTNVANKNKINLNIITVILFILLQVFGAVLLS